MKKLTIENKDSWKEFILREARYELHPDCKGGICVDAGCNIGDFPLNHGTRFDKYVCYDVFDENINECIQNTSVLNMDIEIYKKACWSESNKKINVMAYRPWDTKDIQHFGNSGNVGCVEYEGVYGEGWSAENAIDLVDTISIDDILKQYKTINLLKVDIEGSEYEFLLNKDLSNINYIVGEMHFNLDMQRSLISWIENTHTRIGNFSFVLKK